MSGRNRAADSHASSRQVTNQLTEPADAQTHECRRTKPISKIFISALSSMKGHRRGDVPQWLPRLNEVMKRLWLVSRPSKLNADGSALICGRSMPRAEAANSRFSMKATPPQLETGLLNPCARTVSSRRRVHETLPRITHHGGLNLDRVRYLTAPVHFRSSEFEPVLMASKWWHGAAACIAQVTIQSLNQNCKILCLTGHVAVLMSIGRWLRAV